MYCVKSNQQYCLNEAKVLKSVVIVVDVSKMAYNVLNGTLNSTHSF